MRELVSYRFLTRKIKDSDKGNKSRSVKKYKKTYIYTFFARLDQKWGHINRILKGTDKLQTKISNMSTI